MKHILGIGALCAGLFVGGGVWAAEQNVALHQKVTVSPRSNYSFTKDRNPAQLTDGIYASTHAKWDAKHKTSSIWVQKGALTWTHKKPVIITIDLGKVQPISGLIYSTAGGRAGVGWPDAIYIITSDDGKTWHAAGELVSLSKKNSEPPKEGYANFRYVTHDLKTHGRYVALGIDEQTFVVADEVEVLRGPDSLLKASAGPVVPAMEEYYAQATVTQKAKNRLNADIDSIRGLLKDSGLPGEQVKAFDARLDKDAQATADMAPLPANLKTILPLTDLHRDILAVHGEALAARGLPPLTAWKVHRYAYRPLIEIPQKKEAEINLSMLKDQIRSDSFLLTNATGKPMTVQVRSVDAPQGAQSGWLDVKSAIWTDTVVNEPVQDALLPMETKAGTYELTIPAGLSGKVWVTVDTSKVPAGDFTGAFEVNGGGQSLRVPMKLHVSKVAMGTPRMSLYTWDYTDGKGAYGITPENRQAAIKLMRSHFVDSPWAKGWTLPTPKAGDFNERNELTGNLDFSHLDEWVKMWAGARNYFIFYNVRSKDEFAGSKIGTEAFKAKIGSWMKAVVAHWESLGLQPSQLVICPVDESRNDEYDYHLVQWGGAIKAATPQVQIFSDPIWRDPTQSKYPEAFLIPDILCPHAGWATEFYQKLRDEHGKKIWFYNGPGLHHTGDPQLAYRQMAWRVFAMGGMGEGFWAFGDLSGAPTSWQAYRAARLIYAPAYIDKTTVTDGIHWDATREGVEDFEELSMLKDAIAKTGDAALKEQAQKILDEAVQTVNDNAKDNQEFAWSKGTDPLVVDAQLARVRSMLERMK